MSAKVTRKKGENVNWPLNSSHITEHINKVTNTETEHVNNYSDDTNIKQVCLWKVITCIYNKDSSIQIELPLYGLRKL